MPAKLFFFFPLEQVKTKDKQKGMANSRGRQGGVEYTDKREVRDLGIMNVIPEIPLNVDKVTRLELKSLKMQAWGK